MEAIKSTVRDNEAIMQKRNVSEAVAITSIGLFGLIVWLAKTPCDSALAL